MEITNMETTEESGQSFSDFSRQLHVEPVEKDSVNEESEENDSGVFYFESDQLALKTNKDYHNLVKTILVLEAQREMAVKAIDKVYELFKEVESDPLEFVEKLKRGEGMGLPERQIVPEIPDIDWGRYNLPPPPESYFQSKNKSRNETESSFSASMQHESSWNTCDKRSKLLVRGKAFDNSKPQTFNQLWTSEEQRRLEELLLEFPPEDVESRRWEKIAEALGNRTAKQVQSRVQKYFIKLQKAGLPIPGRCPRLQGESQWRKSSHKHQRNNHFLYKPSTFFPSHDVPMSMSDSDEELNIPKRILVSKDGKIDLSSGDILSSQDQETALTPKMEKCSREHMKLEMLKKVAREIEKTSGNNKFLHVGFQCEFCKEDPIIGTRWHCDECMSAGMSIDYCSDCVITLMEETENPFSSVTPKPKNTPRNPHPLEHILRPIRGQTGKTTSGIWDPDYLPDSFSGRYNYLDPNFMPE